jgi:hypothetical protein
MAKTSIEQGQIIFRQWNERDGLNETTEVFNTLEDLFRLCIEANDPLLVDRVHVTGSDADGNLRKLTLVFQSITISEGKL